MAKIKIEVEVTSRDNNLLYVKGIKFNKRNQKLLRKWLDMQKEIIVKKIK